MVNKIDEIFLQNLLSIGIELDEIKLEQFHDYYELLIEWNQKFNLTAITDYEDVLIKHFLDSMAIVKAVKCDKINTLKIGRAHV